MQVAYILCNLFLEKLMRAQNCLLLYLSKQVLNGLYSTFSGPSLEAGSAGLVGVSHWLSLVKQFR